jgi:hypothetical protein
MFRRIALHTSERANPTHPFGHANGQIAGCEGTTASHQSQSNGAVPDTTTLRTSIGAANVEGMQDDPAFVADVASPLPVRLHLSHTGIDRSSLGALDWLGWELVAKKVSDGQELIFRDHWVETLLEAIAIAGSYSDEPLHWRWERSETATNLFALQPAYDSSRRFQAAIKVEFNPDGEQRLCFNVYDDGCFRFTHEQLIESDQLQAWVPRSWSGEHPDLRSAVDEARKGFSWFN